MGRRGAVSVWRISSTLVSCVFRRTCAVSVGSHISKRRKRAHSVPLMRCFWSAFLAESVCAVMLGQSSRRSKSSNRRLVTKSLTCEAGIGFGCGLVVVVVVVMVFVVFVLTDRLRAWPRRVEALALALEASEVGRDMVSGWRATCAPSLLRQQLRAAAMHRCVPWWWCNKGSTRAQTATATRTPERRDKRQASCLLLATNTRFHTIDPPRLALAPPSPRLHCIQPTLSIRLLLHRHHDRRRGHADQGRRRARRGATECTRRQAEQLDGPEWYVMKDTASSVCGTSPTPSTAPAPPLLTPSPVLAEVEHGYAESTDSPVPFFHLLERLKTTKRAGWRRFGIDNCESISDHMYRMSILTMMAPQSVSSKLDILRCCRMALIHDMAESLVGDITPVDPVSKEEKSRRESETMDYICTNLLGNFNGGLNGKDIRHIWQEYEDSETPESLFVHDVDKMELLLQMLEYERSQKCDTDLGEFTWVAQKIKSPEIKTWAAAVFRDRQELWKKAGKTCSWRADTEPKDQA